MKLHIGTEIIGYKGELGDPLYLTTDDLRTHVHGIGQSQRGKSRLLAKIVRELLKAGQGVCFIDPHGAAYDLLVNWLAYVDPPDLDLALMNPSHKRVVGFNPFHLAGPKTEDRITTKVERMVEAILRVWGITEAGNAPRLERWLRSLFYVIVEQDYSLEVARFFRGSENEDIRRRIIESCKSDFIRDEWRHVTAGRQLDAQLESTMNKLFKLIVNPTVRRVMGLRENTLDLKQIVDRCGVLLVNLQESETFPQEAGRVIGTLLVNEIVGLVRRRRTNNPTPFYLVIDEFHNFATPDLPIILDQLAKYGLHLILFNQRMSQLSSDIRGALKNTDTKIIFGGVTRKEVAELLETSRPSTLHEEDEDWDEYDTTVIHPPRYFSFSRMGRPLTFGYAATVKDSYETTARQHEYEDSILQEFLTKDEVDARLAELTKRLKGEKSPEKLQLEKPPAKAPAPAESPSTQISNNPQQDEISDDDLFE